MNANYFEAAQLIEAIGHHLEVQRDDDTPDLMPVLNLFTR